MSFEIEDLDILIDEIKRLQEENETLVKDNRELRDLCCFLDDVRRQFKRLFKEWQKNVSHSIHILLYLPLLAKPSQDVILPTTPHPINRARR